MLWYSSRTQTLARELPSGLEVTTAGTPLATLSGTLAGEFVEAFLSAGTPAKTERLALAARLGSAVHARLLDLALAGGGERWIPGMSVHSPAQLFLEVTGRCNERCQHCYASAGPRVGAALSRDECLRVIAEGRALGFDALQLTGGDPLLCAFLPELAGAARAEGFPLVEVYTNGLALTPPRLEELAVHGVDFAFSVYSHAPEIHDGVTRVPGSLARTSLAIRRVVEAGLSARVSIIALEAAAEGLSRTREHVESLGVPTTSISMDIPRQVGRGEGLAVPELPEGALRPGHRGQQATVEARLAGETLEAGAPEALERLRWPGKLAVAYTGDVLPCIFARAQVLGNVRREALGAVVERLRERRARHPVDPERFADKLACHDCRYTAAVWEGGA